jgi:hypothetical protein
MIQTEEVPHQYQAIWQVVDTIGESVEYVQPIAPQGKLVLHTLATGSVANNKKGFRLC